MLLSLPFPARALHDCAGEQTMLPDRALMSLVAPASRRPANSRSARPDCKDLTILLTRSTDIFLVAPKYNLSTCGQVMRNE